MLVAKAGQHRMCSKGYTLGMVLQGHIIARDINQQHILYYFKRLPVLVISTCFTLTLHLRDFVLPMYQILTWCGSVWLRWDNALEERCGCTEIPSHLLSSWSRLLLKVNLDYEICLFGLSIGTLAVVKTLMHFSSAAMPAGPFFLTEASKCCWKTTRTSLLQTSLMQGLFASQFRMLLHTSEPLRGKRIGYTVTTQRGKTCREIHSGITCWVARA